MDNVGNVADRVLNGAQWAHELANKEQSFSCPELRHYLTSNRNLRVQNSQAIQTTYCVIEYRDDRKKLDMYLACIVFQEKTQRRESRGFMLLSMRALFCHFGKWSYGGISVLCWNNLPKTTLNALTTTTEYTYWGPGRQDGRLPRNNAPWRTQSWWNKAD